MSNSKSTCNVSKEVVDSTIDLRLQQLSPMTKMHAINARTNPYKARDVDMHFALLDVITSTMTKWCKDKKDNNLATSFRNIMNNIKMCLKCYQRIEDKIILESFRGCSQVIEFDVTK